MTVEREKFSSRVRPELLSKMREIARSDGRKFEDVLEDAMRSYIETRERPNVRPEVMAHFRASLERNRRLMELLAKS